MSLEEYWIGKGINLEDLWRNFESGQGYIRKFESIEPYLLRLTFENHPLSSPLFDLEVLYKTIKGTFHDVKVDSLTPQA